MKARELLNTLLTLTDEQLDSLDVVTEIQGRYDPELGVPERVVVEGQQISLTELPA